MKTVRYEVRRIGKEVHFSDDNVFKAYDYYDNHLTDYGRTIYTIHEITTIEKDITETAKGKENERVYNK